MNALSWLSIVTFGVIGACVTYIVASIIWRVKLQISWWHIALAIIAVLVLSFVFLLSLLGGYAQ